MAETTKIEWTEATWNPWHGCHKVSAGCKNCYMFREKKHYGQDPNVVVRSKTKFYDPLKWKEPRRIFTCSWSDFFIEESDPWRDEAFAIMALTPHHTYQVLTKRPDRMYQYLTEHWPSGIIEHLRRLGKVPEGQGVALSTRNGFLRNVWLGISAEDRDTYITRIPYLVMTPGNTKFVSFEPLLGDIGDLMLDGIFEHAYQWAIVGGESGPNARPLDVKWARQIVRQCRAGAVPVFVKQLGANVWDVNDAGYEGDYPHEWPMDTDTDDWHLDPSRNYQGAPCRVMLGDRKGGNMNEWPEDLRIREMPEVQT
jgi:protein gp37